MPMAANQSSLDAAASDARRLAGDAHYTGCRMNSKAGKVEVWLASASVQRVERLTEMHPRVYLIHNDAPRSEAALFELRDALSGDLLTLRADGIRVVAFRPTHDGYLHVRVMGDVPTAQARLDAMYGSNVARVEYGEPARQLPLRGR